MAVRALRRVVVDEPAVARLLHQLVEVGRAQRDDLLVVVVDAEVVPVELPAVVLLPARLLLPVEARLAVQVVLLAQLAVLQHLIGAIDLDERVVRLWVVLVLVGVQPHGQCLERLAHRAVVGVAFHAQQFVVVSVRIGRRRRSHDQQQQQHDDC